MHEDYKYIRALLQNDHQILNELYQKFLPRIEAMVIKNSGSVQDAFDIFQEALIVIYKKALQPGFQLTSKFYTFLYGVCNNLWKKKLVKKNPKQLINPPEEAYSNIDLIEEVMEDEKRHQLFSEKFLELSSECQQMIRLFFKKVRAKEIVKTMAYKNENTVIQKHHKCKKQLIKLIREDDRFEA